ncbi:MAG: SDR family oxidoreductase [Xanthomonadales bacterium]|nr:SDR family oxidoreductase [Xanthomonadales bacterium]
MSKKKPPYALITGASSGIGAELARAWARRGQPLILVARRTDRLRALADELSPSVPCEVLTCDLEDPDAPASLERELERRGLPVAHLVNNAGYGVPGTYRGVAWEVHQRFLQIMVHAVCELSWRLLPGIQQHRGGIINVASLAGHVPGSAGHTLYGASKAFMIKFSQSLALENKPRGVRVLALCPGFTLSEFHDITGTRKQVSRMPKWMWMTSEQVAEDGLQAYERGEIVWIPGRMNRMIKRFTEALPDRLALGIVQKRSNRFRKLD